MVLIPSLYKQFIRRALLTSGGCHQTAMERRCAGPGPPSGRASVGRHKHKAVTLQTFASGKLRGAGVAGSNALITCVILIYKQAPMTSGGIVPNRGFSSGVPLSSGTSTQGSTRMQIAEFAIKLSARTIAVPDKPELAPFTIFFCFTEWPSWHAPARPEQ